MEVMLNGELTSLEGVPTVADVLGGLQVNPAAVAICVNGHILNQGSLGNIELHEGDAVEVLPFLGGGFSGV